MKRAAGQLQLKSHGSFSSDNCCISEPQALMCSSHFVRYDKKGMFVRVRIKKPEFCLLFQEEHSALYIVVYAVSPLLSRTSC